MNFALLPHKAELTFNIKQQTLMTTQIDVQGLPDLAAFVSAQRAQSKKSLPLSCLFDHTWSIALGA